MKDISLTIELEKENLLRSKFPQEETFGHVSLTLIGRIGKDDSLFLNGLTPDVTIDEDIIEEVYQTPDRKRWNTIDIDFSKVNSDDFNRLGGSLKLIEGLTGITFPCGYDFKSAYISRFLDDHTVYIDKTVESIVLSEGTKKIIGNSFQNWVVLKKASFPKSLEKISASAFVGCCSLESFGIPKDSEHFFVCDDVVFSPDKAVLIAYPPGKKDEKYEIPNGTTMIAESAFKHNPFIKEITIPKTVVCIQDFAFESCASLEKFHLVRPNPVFILDNDEEILLKRKFIYMHEGPFPSEKRVSEIVCLAANAKREALHINDDFAVGPHAFTGCKNLKRIKIDKSSFDYDTLAIFDFCKCLEEITLCHFDILPPMEDSRGLKILNIEGIFYNRFENCIRGEALKEVNITNNPDYYSKDGVVFTKDHDLYYYPKAREETTYNAPEETTDIYGFRCFYSKYLKEVRLPSSFDMKKVIDNWEIADEYIEGPNCFIYNHIRFVKS